MRTSFTSLLTTVAASALFATGAAHAQTVTVIGGDSVVNVPSTEYPSPWDVDGTLVVGQAGAGNGTLNITNGGEVISYSGGWVGSPFAAGGEDPMVRGVGSVLVDGSGSSWTSMGTPATSAGISISNGTLTISDNAIVRAMFVNVGRLGEGRLVIGGVDADGQFREPGRLSDFTTVHIGNGVDPVTGIIGSGVLEFAHGWVDPVPTSSGTGGYYTFARAISGSGTILHTAGVTHLTGSSGAFAGNTEITGGTLRVDGILGGNMTVASSAPDAGATLAGYGAVLGDVVIKDGGTLGGVLGLPPFIGNNLSMGSLTLESGAIVHAGAINLQGVPDQSPFLVHGDLVLDGELHVSLLGGAFGPGMPETAFVLFDYAGELTDNGFAIGKIPLGYAASDFTLDMSPANRVMLTVGEASNTFFWNGPGNGGDGVWSHWHPAQTDVWVNSVNPDADYANPDALMIFDGTGGTVTVDAGEAEAVAMGGGLRFDVDGYHIEGDALELGAPSTMIGIGGGMTATITSELVGAGGIDKDGDGTLVLAGTNGYAGGTTITAGALRGAASSFGAGAIVNEGSLVIDEADDVDFANSISGSGNFTKTGAGRLSLTGGGAFTGQTLVDAGTLAVNSDTMLRASSVTLAEGARLGGNGAMGSLRVSAGAIVAPGNSIGTLHVAGDLVADAGWIYEVETDAAGNADRIAVGGTASIGGGLVRVLPGEGNYAPSTSYTILTAENVDGAFASVTSSLAFLTPSLSYSTNDVILTLTRNNIDFSSIGETRNQQAAGAGIESLGMGAVLWDAVVQLDAGTARAAFDHLSGEIHASAQAALIEDSHFVRDAATERLRTVAPEGNAVWGRAFGSWGHISADGNAARLKRSAGGFLIGVDGQLSAGVRLGIVGGYSHTDLSSIRGSADSDNYHLGV